MPRRARQVIPGIPWHIIQRGHNRRPVSRKTVTTRISGNPRRTGSRIPVLPAYLVPDDESPTPAAHTRHRHSAALLMKHLGQRYVQYINRTWQRSGTLREGRRRSGPVQNSGYLLSCYRYIELNPVRAGMVTHPAEYRWSSYRSNGQGEHQDWLTPHPEYLAPGNSRETRLAVTATRSLTLSIMNLSRKSAAQPTATVHWAMIASSQQSSRG